MRLVPAGNAVPMLGFRFAKLGWRCGLTALVLCTSTGMALAQARGSLNRNPASLLGRPSDAGPRDHELTVETLEHGSWLATMAALQRDPGSEGRTVHVLVSESDGTRAPCGSYNLNIDEADAGAFEVLDCDSSTNATSVRLRSRTALFDHGGVVPVPRTVQLSATQVRVASSSGGAPLTGGAVLICSARVRPYLDDIEHGTHVALTPDAYEARVRTVHVDVQQESDGWLLSTRSREQFDIAYEVVDRHTHEVVLRDEAHLTCASGPGRGDAEGAGPQVLVTRDGRLFRGAIAHPEEGRAVVHAANGTVTRVPASEILYEGRQAPVMRDVEGSAPGAQYEYIRFRPPVHCHQTNQRVPDPDGEGYSIRRVRHCRRERLRLFRREGRDRLLCDGSCDLLLRRGTRSLVLLRETPAVWSPSVPGALTVPQQRVLHSRGTLR